MKIKIILLILCVFTFVSCEETQNSLVSPDESDQAPIDIPDDNSVVPEAPPADNSPPDSETSDEVPSDVAPPSEEPVESDNPVVDDPEPAVPTPKLSFKTSSPCVDKGKAVVVSWDVKDAEFVYFEGQQVKSKGQATLYPQNLKTLKLSGVNGMNVVTKSLEVGVKTKKIKYELKEQAQWKQVLDALSVAADGKFLALSEGSLFKGQSDFDFAPLDPNSYVGSWASMALDPTDSKIMYAATDGRVYRSTDGGGTWPDVIPVRRNNTDLAINTLYVSPENSSLVFIGVSGGAFILDTASPSLDLMTDLNKKEVTLFAAGANLVLASTDKGLMFSSNEGGSWASFHTPADIEDISVIVFDQDKIWVGSSQGLYRTDFEGGVWEHFDIVEGRVNDVAVYEHYVVIAAASGVYSNQGNVWKRYVEDEINWVMGGPNLEKTSLMTPDHAYQLSSSETSENHCPIAKPRARDLAEMQKWDLSNMLNRKFDQIRPIKANLIPYIKRVDR
ncbi:MAG: BNR repeat-containing glycosyl hydrolase [uncultured bacterium]|nr:MAG: BNR repeat-containing glycosyl hydrolase [uncultured bacterium]